MTAPGAGRAPIYVARRAAERCVEQQGVLPIRLFATLFPLWQVEIRAQLHEAQPYDLVDRFVEQAIATCAIDTEAGLAVFLGLEPSFVRRVLHFLELIGHLSRRGGRVALTELGLRSVRDGARYVRKEGRQRLLFDGFTLAPLPRDYYAGDVVVLTEPEYQPKDRVRFQALSADVVGGERDFRPEAVQRLAERPDRERFNLPQELLDTEILAVSQVYLPVYLVDALLPDRSRRFVAFSQVAGDRDHLIETLVADTPAIRRVLEAEDPQDPDAVCGSWLEQRGLSVSTLAPLPNGTWRAVLPAGEFGDDGKLQLFQLGSFEVAQRYFFQLWCDDPATRRRTVLARASGIVQRKDVATREDLLGRLAALSRQLEVDPVDIAELRAFADRTGQHDRVDTIDAL
jgi:hypothetical protein